jgi:hypothetical protein
VLTNTHLLREGRACICGVQCTRGVRQRGRGNRGQVKQASRGVPRAVEVGQAMGRGRQRGRKGRHGCPSHRLAVGEVPMCSVATKAREMVDDSRIAFFCCPPCTVALPLPLSSLVAIGPTLACTRSNFLARAHPCPGVLNCWLLLPQRIAGFVGIAGLLLAAAPRTATAWPGMKSAGLGVTPHSHGLGDDDASHIGPSCTVGVGAGGRAAMCGIHFSQKFFVLCKMGQNGGEQGLRGTQQAQNNTATGGIQHIET